MAFFTIKNDQASVLSPRRFEQEYSEDDLQRWANECPSLLNDGIAMLSLGREIVTKHGHYIDNLYLDGNGTLVVAELKRGKNTRDIHAQVIEYGAYADQLTWNDIERFCKTHSNDDLQTCFNEMFGRSLDVSEKVEHRLLIVAESFDQRAIDTGSYLEKKGLAITFLEFTYYELASGGVLQTNLALGSIPDQVPAGIKVSDREDRASVEYNKWLFQCVASKIPEISKAQGWGVQYRINKQSISFVNTAWPTAYGELTMSVATWAKDSVSPWLYANDQTLPDFGAFLKRNKHRWHKEFPAEQTDGAKKSGATSYLCRLPSPPMGDEQAVRDIMAHVKSMTNVLMPLLDEYFIEHDKGRNDNGC